MRERGGEEKKQKKQQDEVEAVEGQETERRRGSLQLKFLVTSFLSIHIYYYKVATKQRFGCSIGTYREKESEVGEIHGGCRGSHQPQHLRITVVRLSTSDYSSCGN